MAMGNHTSGPGSRAGRPSKLTPQVRASICDYVSKGVPLKFAAAANSVNYITVFNWRQKGEADLNTPNEDEPRDRRNTIYAQFVLEYEKAKADFLATQSMVVMKHAVGFNTQGGGRREGDWRAAAWLLEHQGENHWVPDQQVNHNISGAVDHNVSGQVNHVHIELPDDAERLLTVASVLSDIGALQTAIHPELPKHTDGDVIDMPEYAEEDQSRNDQTPGSNGSNGYHPQPPRS
jgi:hypothetical protein